MIFQFFAFLVIIEATVFVPLFWVYFSKSNSNSSIVPLSPEVTSNRNCPFVFITERILLVDIVVHSTELHFWFLEYDHRVVGAANGPAGALNYKDLYMYSKFRVYGVSNRRLLH